MNLIITIILALLLIPAAADCRMNVGVLGGGVAAAAASYTDILFYHDCEQDNAHYSAADATPSIQVDAAISSTQHAIGSNSLSIPTAYSRFTYTLNTNDIVDTVSGIIGFYVYITTWPSNTGLVYVRYPTANHYINIRAAVSTTNRLWFNFRAGGDSVDVITTNVFSTNTWYFVEFSWNTATPIFKGYVTGGVYSTRTEIMSDTTTTGNLTTATNGTLELGDYEGNADAAAYIDQFYSSNDPTRDLNAIKDCAGTCHP